MTQSPHHHRGGRLHAAFSQPAGVLGALGAITMAIENRRANLAVVDQLGLQPRDTVMEIGCGPGTAARHAARAIGTPGAVTAVDAAAVMVKTARLLSLVDRAPRVTWLHGTAEELPTRGTASVVFAINSWHHWPDHDRALQQITAMLEPGGKVCIAERTDRSHHRFAHGLDQAGVDSISDALAAIGTVTVTELAAGREHLALIRAQACQP